jgi:hypothetical protein
LLLLLLLLVLLAMPLGRKTLLAAIMLKMRSLQILLPPPRFKCTIACRHMQILTTHIYACMSRLITHLKIR